MKKLYLKVIIVLIPVVLLVIIFPVDKRLRYQYLSNDCFDHALWIHDRIFYNDTAIDIAFLGSSHTVNGINDKEIENYLSEKSLHIANLGYCRLGRNLTYVILKDLLKKKKPKAVIIEVRGGEDWFSHPIFPHLADERDILFPVLLVNRNIADDYYRVFAYKMQIIQDIILNRVPEVAVRQDLYGHATSGDTASADYLMHIKELREKPRRRMKKLEENFQLKFPRTYLKKIDKLCRNNNIQTIFLYLTYYGDPKNYPNDLKLYERYGTIIYSPDTIMKNPDNWYDDEHLNRIGAHKLAKFLAKELNEAVK